MPEMTMEEPFGFEPRFQIGDWVRIFRPGNYYSLNLTPMLVTEIHYPFPPNTDITYKMAIMGRETSQVYDEVSEYERNLIPYEFRRNLGGVSGYWMNWSDNEKTQFMRYIGISESRRGVVDNINEYLPVIRDTMREYMRERYYTGTRDDENIQAKNRMSLRNQEHTNERYLSSRLWARWDRQLNDQDRHAVLQFLGYSPNDTDRTHWNTNMQETILAFLDNWETLPWKQGAEQDTAPPDDEDDEYEGLDALFGKGNPRKKHPLHDFPKFPKQMDDWMVEEAKAMESLMLDTYQHGRENPDGQRDAQADATQRLMLNAIESQRRATLERLRSEMGDVVFDPENAVVRFPDGTTKPAVMDEIGNLVVTMRHGQRIGIRGGMVWDIPTRPYHLQLQNLAGRTIRAFQDYFENIRPYRGTESEKQEKMRNFLSNLCEIYEMDCPSLSFVRRGQCGDGYYNSVDNAIFLPKVTVTSLLHEFRHAMQFQKPEATARAERHGAEPDARAWSLSVWYLAEPEYFRQMVTSGTIFYITISEVGEGESRE